MDLVNGVMKGFRDVDWSFNFGCCVLFAWKLIVRLIVLCIFGQIVFDTLTIVFDAKEYYFILLLIPEFIVSYSLFYFYWDRTIGLLFISISLLLFSFLATHLVFPECEKEIMWVPGQGPKIVSDVFPIAMYSPKDRKHIRRMRFDYTRVYEMEATTKDNQQVFLTIEWRKKINEKNLYKPGVIDYLFSEDLGEDGILNRISKRERAILLNAISRLDKADIVDKKKGRKNVVDAIVKSANKVKIPQLRYYRQGQDGIRLLVYDGVELID